MATSPSVLNYSVLKGIAKFTPTDGVQRDLGNAPEVELTPEVTKLDHFSSRSGVKSKDKSVVTEKTLTLRIVLDELTRENVRMQLMGGVSDTSGEFGIFADSEITGAFEFTGTNDIGSKIFLELPDVSFGPSGSLNLISDEWGQVELTAEVLFDEVTGDFGKCNITEAEA